VFTRQNAVRLAALVGMGLLSACNAILGAPDFSAASPDGSAHDAVGLATDGAPADASSGGPKPVVESKVDLLFDIDNSASMQDKQNLLIDTIPELIARLVTPNCIDGTTAAATGNRADPLTGQCPSGSHPEFAAVSDMHIGVVTSSLGPRLGVQQSSSAGEAPVYICDPSRTVTSQSGMTVSAYNDDQGHLINRTVVGAGAPLPEAALPEGGGFLYWFPGGDPATAAPAAITTTGSELSPDTLIGDFDEFVGAAGESGCGIESQLESWYRFLIQPDPYASLSLGDPTNGGAQWVGVDTTILQQRHDFLRPDSVVAVVVLTDENDSEIDVRSYRGSGYLFMSNTFTPPRATAACQANPNDPSCTTCGGSSAVSQPCIGPFATTEACTDNNCMANNGAFDFMNDGNDWGFNLNLRHVHMRQKYGLDAQYPLTRYYNGLSSTKVPNRSGEYPTSSSSYTGTNNCTNTLFAATLPQASDVTDGDAGTPTEINTTLCELPIGTSRNAGDVFFLHIGGVPYQLLQSTPGDGTCATGTPASDCPQKSALAQTDWVKILGTGPASFTGAGGTMSYDYTGIDPHMIESMTPRNNLGTETACGGGTCPGAAEPAPTSNPSVSSLEGPTLVASAPDPVRPDPINGREWTTNAGIHSLPVDREYACIFQLQPKSQRDCAMYAGNSIEGNSCECAPGNQSATPWSAGGPPGPTGNTPDEISPLCSKTSTDGTISSAVNDYTVQTYAKVYPTIRELMLANMMGTQGVVSSMCPIHPADNSTQDDPLYAYRPGVDALVSRMKGALQGSR